MTKAHDEEIARFSTSLYRRANTTGEAWEAIRELPPIGRKLRRIFERQCNGYQTPAGTENVAAAKRDETLEELLTKRAQEIAGRVGASLYVQGDPRGAPLYLIFPGDVPEGQDVGSYYSRGLCVPA